MNCARARMRRNRAARAPSQQNRNRRHAGVTGARSQSPFRKFVRANLELRRLPRAITRDACARFVPEPGFDDETEARVLTSSKYLALPPSQSTRIGGNPTCSRLAAHRRFGVPLACPTAQRQDQERPLEGKRSWIVALSML